MKKNTLVSDVLIITAAVLLLSCQRTTPASAQYVLQNAFPNLPRFTSPVDLQTIPDGSNRFVVVQQGGKVYAITNDPNVSDTSLMLDITSKIRSGGEMGLLGCAFHPNFTQNHFVYFNYTANVGNQLTSFVSRFTVTGTGLDTVEVSSEQVLLTVNQPFENHNGGCIQFGPDGNLYIGFGDGGSGGDPQGNGQKLTTLLGKILRIDVDHPADGKNYGIPATNPYKGNSSGFKEEIYAYGLRNPWRFSFDATTGKLWSGDVGQGNWEEIDIIENGKNYGWKVFEGRHCYNQSSCDSTGMTMPIWEYSHGEGVSVTGGYVYRGSKLPELAGKYIYADLNGKVWALTESPVSNQAIGGLTFGISSFGILPDGEIVIVHLSNGRLYKIVNPNGVGSAKPQSSIRIRLPANPISRSASTIMANIDVIHSVGALTVSLLDELGNTRSTEEKNIHGDETAVAVDLSSIAKTLSAGLYFLRVTDGITTVSEKLIVE